MKLNFILFVVTFQKASEETRGRQLKKMRAIERQIEASRIKSHFI
ncbi:hypothetical protein [Halobacillus salinus]|nr:hypothetical protein [Halobacillus salinus]